jgi:murein DD-endopeptidase MepM/ murein hydrolase activator NlpD
VNPFLEDLLRPASGMVTRGARKRRQRRLLLMLGLGVVITLWLFGPLLSKRNAAAVEERPDPVTGLLTLEAPRIDRLEEIANGELPGVAGPMAIPAHVSGSIQPGQSLFAALVSHGVPETSIHPVVAALQQVFDFRRSQPGHEYEADVDPSGLITWIRYRTAPETIFEARRIGEGAYESRQVPVELNIEVHGLSGVVSTSLIGAFIQSGERESLAQEFVEVFQWDLDFSSDVRSGDAFRIVFEKVFLDGEFLRYGRVLAAEYRGQRAAATAFLFEGDELTGYYLADGRSVERLFLAAPCRYRRISSLYDPNRLHPVLRVRRPHLGVDYAAATGTPVYAVADGTVTFAGRRGGNGNLVSIRHAHGYDSGYAHLHRFARGIRTGVAVEQGQIIGYVGSTGLSTGPHLHFALKRNRQFVDPLGEHDIRRPPLTGRALRDFQRLRNQLQAELERLPIPDVQQIALEQPAEGSVEAMDFVDGDFATGEF